MTVSVCMITYGHESFIGQAIEGVLMQKCNFEVELIIADDCSPDNTQEIVEKYINTHPKGFWIKYTRHAKNKGVMQNFLWALKQCSGKYIALCEGDDYWIDDYKLQKQVLFLEQNPIYSFCHTDVKVLQNRKLLNPNPLKRWNKEKSVATLNEALKIPVAFTCTAIFRNYGDLSRYFFSKNVSGDWQLWVILMLFGDAYFMDYCSAVYRKGIGISSNSKFNPFKGRSFFLMRLFFITKNISVKKKMKVLKYCFYYLVKSKKFKI